MALAALQITVQSELARFIEQRVASGQLASTQQVVEEGLRLLEEQETRDADTFRLIRDKVRRG